MPSVSPKTTAAVTTVEGSTANNASQEALPANGKRVYLLIQNLSNADLYVRFGAEAEASAGSLKLPANSTVPLEWSGSFVPSQSVNVFCATSSKAYTVLEG